MVWMAAWEERAEDSGCSRRLTGKDPLDEVSHDPDVQGPRTDAINRLENPCRRPGLPMACGGFASWSGTAWGGLGRLGTAWDSLGQPRCATPPPAPKAQKGQAKRGGFFLAGLWCLWCLGWEPRRILHASGRQDDRVGAWLAPSGQSTAIADLRSTYGLRYSGH